MYIYVYNVYTYRERSYVTVASLASDKSKIQMSSRAFWLTHWMMYLKLVGYFVAS